MTGSTLLAILRHAVATGAMLIASVVVASPASAELPSQDTWEADVVTAMDGSGAYLSQRVEQGGQQLAVNLDIDNTSLASHYDPGAPVERVLRFAKRARSLGVSLVFNTARLRGGGRMHEARQQLQRAGYEVAAICGRRAGESLAHSKQRCRRAFVAQGYTIVANIGNRETDFVGGDYERAFRLPNYDNQLT